MKLSFQHVLESSYKSFTYKMMSYHKLHCSSFQDLIGIELLPYLKNQSSLGVDRLEKPSTGLMVIIEFRKHPLLEFICHMFAYGLARHGWGLMLIYGDENASFVEKLASSWKGDLILKKISNHSIHSKEDYSKFCLNPDLWYEMPCENLMIFQTDTMLFHTKGLENESCSLLQYPYVGAPWASPKGDAKVFVGNGGLSLRKRSFCIDASNWYQRANIKAYVPEDIIFATYLKQELKVEVPIEVAEKFSVETYTSGGIKSHPPNGTHLLYRTILRGLYPHYLSKSPLVRDLFLLS